MASKHTEAAAQGWIAKMKKHLVAEKKNKRIVDRCFALNVSADFLSASRNKYVEEATARAERSTEAYDYLAEEDGVASALDALEGTIGPSKEFEKNRKKLNALYEEVVVARQKRKEKEQQERLEADRRREERIRNRKGEAGAQSDQGKAGNPK